MRWKKSGGATIQRKGGDHDTQAITPGNAKCFESEHFPLTRDRLRHTRVFTGAGKLNLNSLFFNKLGNAALQSGKAHSRKLPWHTNWPVSHARLAFHLIVMQRKSNIRRFICRHSDVVAYAKSALWAGPESLADVCIGSWTHEECRTASQGYC